MDVKSGNYNPADLMQNARREYATLIASYFGTKEFQCAKSIWRYVSPRTALVQKIYSNDFLAFSLYAFDSVLDFRDQERPSSLDLSDQMKHIYRLGHDEPIVGIYDTEKNVEHHITHLRTKLCFWWWFRGAKNPIDYLKEQMLSLIVVYAAVYELDLPANIQRILDRAITGKGCKLDLDEGMHQFVTLSRLMDESFADGTMTETFTESYVADGAHPRIAETKSNLIVRGYAQEIEDASKKCISDFLTFLNESLEPRGFIDQLFAMKNHAIPPCLLLTDKVVKVIAQTFHHYV